MTPSTGHNSAAVKKDLDNIVTRVETLRAERKGINDDIAEIMAEAKAKGFNGPLIGEMLKLKAMDKEKRTLREDERDLYINALGLI